MSLVVYVEGNIGAGKSTVIAKLKNTYSQDDCLVMTEPVSNWPSLKLFYEDKRRYAFQLQTEVFETFHRRETACPERKFYIMERSLNSAMNIFSSLNCTAGEVERLRGVYDTIGRSNLDPDTRSRYIYLRTPAHKCLANIQKRQKATDSYITLDYLKVLERKHDDVYDNSARTPDVVIIDGMQSEEAVFADMCSAIDNIIKGGGGVGGEQVSLGDD